MSQQDDLEKPPHPLACFRSLEGACWFCLRDCDIYQSIGHRACSLAPEMINLMVSPLMILIEYTHAGM